MCDAKRLLKGLQSFVVLLPIEKKLGKTELNEELQ